MERKLSGWVQLLRRHLKRAGRFYRKHFVFKIAVPLILMVLLMALVFHGYLRNQYLSFLMDEIYRTDKVFLSTQNDIVSEQMVSMIRLGSKFAIDESLYEAITRAVINDDATLGQYYARDMFVGLLGYDNSILQVAIAAGGENVYQYNRNRRISGNDGFWNEENAEELADIYGRLQEKIEKKVSGVGTDCYILTPVTDAGDDGSAQCLVHIAYPLIGRQTSFQKAEAMIVLTCEMQPLTEFLTLSAIDGQGYSYGFVADETGKIIFSEKKEQIGKAAEDYEHEAQYEVFQDSVTNVGWTMYLVIDNAGMSAHADHLYRRGIIIYLVLLVAIMVCIVLMLRASLKPVEQISIAIDTVRAGELNQKIDIHGEDEIWRLAIQYNEMTDSLQEQQIRTQEEYNKNIESMKRAAEAERQALESQINAHFICNTLGAIHYSAMENGNEELSVMLRKLSNILRYTFSRSYQEVTVVQELAWVQQYLYLQKYRLGDVFDYEINYPEEYDAWPCPKLFLQPFVENSIVHGFEGRDRGGIIRLNCGLAEGRLVMTIADNGCGIPAEKAAKLQSMIQGNNTIDYQGIGIGIQNVTARLRMFYGSRFEIRMQSREKEGTQFTLYLPIPESMLDDMADDWADCEAED